MRCGRRPRADHAAHDVAIAFLGGEIDRRRRTLFAPANVTQVYGLAEPAMRVANQEDGFPRRGSLPWRQEPKETLGHGE